LGLIPDIAGKRPRVALKAIQIRGSVFICTVEDNVVAYKTENGKRSNIGVKGKGNAYGVNVDVPHQKWNTLRIIMKGNLIEIFLNHTKLFEVENNTFSEAGKVGLWTKADAVTQFDDLRVQSLDRTP